MKSRLGTALVVCLAPALSVGACSSGGGGTPGTPLPPTPTNPVVGGFTSFAAMPKPGTSNLPGITTEVSYVSSPPKFDLTSHSTPASGTGTVTLTVDTGGNITALAVNGAQSSVTFNAANGSTFGNLAIIGAPNATAYQTGDGKSLAIGANYTALGYNYQTFGVWATGIASGSGNIGAISAGAATQNSAVPTTGTATFTGNAGGIYVDPQGQGYLAASDANLVTNFGTHSINYSTTNSAAVNPTTAGTLSNPAILNMQGTLNYAAGSNDFSGSVSSSGLNGSAKGRFYGPTANEAGGTFALTGSGVQSYIGAFGAKQ